MIRTLTKRHHTYIRKHYKKMTDKQIGEKLKVSNGTVASFRKREKLRVSKKETQRRRSAALHANYLAKKFPKEDRIIKRYYITLTYPALAAKVGRSETFVMNRIKHLGLKVPRKVIQQRVIGSRIKPGQTPPNKGRKQAEYMSQEAIERTKATRFRKGQKIWNEKENGDIRIRHDHPDRAGRCYQYIRIRKGVWKMLHVYNWEKENGRIPKGHIVVFKTRDTMNCEPSNLELITRAENMARNTIHRYPEELKTIIRLNNKLKKVINATDRKETAKHAQ